ncbi:MAG: hypothetical protein ACAI43_18295 [Phycisphaerae bacterium]|nr:hypothetical protein [Tepidisphaeraceae bacterium]
MTRLALAVIATALLSGCYADFNPTSSADKKPVDAKPAGSTAGYREVIARGNIYVVTSKANADAAIAGALADVVPGPTDELGRKVFFEKANAPALAAEYAKLHK